MNRDEFAAELAKHTLGSTVLLDGGSYYCKCKCGAHVDRPGEAHRAHVAAAVLPLIEADVRERIATEIEAQADPSKDTGSKADRYQRIGMQSAARIARGADYD